MSEESDAIVSALSSLQSAVVNMQNVLDAVLKSIDVRNEHTHLQHGHG